MAKNTKAKDALSMFDSAGIVRNETVKKKPEPVLAKVEEEQLHKEQQGKPKAKNVPTKAEEKAPAKMNPTKIPSSINLDFKKRAKGTARSFYVPDDLYEKLKAVAERNGIPISTCLANILEQVL